MVKVKYNRLLHNIISYILPASHSQEIVAERITTLKANLNCALCLLKNIILSLDP